MNVRRPVAVDWRHPAGNPIRNEHSAAMRIRMFPVRAGCQYVPPGGHAIEGPLKVPFEEKAPLAAREGVVGALKNQLKYASSTRL